MSQQEDGDTLHRVKVLVAQERGYAYVLISIKEGPVPPQPLIGVVRSWLVCSHCQEPRDTVHDLVLEHAESGRLYCFDVTKIVRVNTTIVALDAEIAQAKVQRALIQERLDALEAETL